MDLQSANQIKQAISSSFLRSQNEQRIIYAAAVAPGASSIRKRVQADVKGVGIGDKLNGENFIKVLVKKRSHLTAAELYRYFGSRAGDLTVEHISPIRFKYSQEKHRPFFPGISVGHFKVTAGTLGCFVKDAANRIYILSNNHVLANTNLAKIHDEILQPGKLDGGRKNKDVVAKLSNFVKLDVANPNFMDAAIAEVLDDQTTFYPINKVIRVRGTVLPDAKMKVAKYGRTTQLKNGRITVKDLDMKVDFDGQEIEFYDQFEVKGYSGAMFCDGGDSGSLIYERDSHKAVGLLFAGTEDGTTFATPIKKVLQQFSVKIL